jgi:hypothetical protein
MFKAVVFDLYEILITQSGTVVPRAGALGNHWDSTRRHIAANGRRCGRGCSTAS